jgi:chromosome segregation ATPase
MSDNNAAVLDTPPASEKWESEEEFEARLNRIQTNVATGELATSGGGVDSDEVSQLKTENLRLKNLVDEARRRVTQLEVEAQKVLKRDEDNEKMLEEKSEAVRMLEERVAELESKQSTGVSEEELVALHAELERERQNLEDDRQAMEEQFRQLELSMARERAEIARERNELQRTKTELKHKLETVEKSAQSDMSPLRRLRDELRGEGANNTNKPNLTSLPTMPNLPALNRKAPEGEETPKRSGILSRFLGKKDE